MAAKASSSDDRRVRRTRRALREALINLVLERGYDEVSVQDVCERADVGRSTFYTHFADKEEVLLSGFDDLRKALREEAAARTAEGRPLGFVDGMIEHAKEHSRVFRAIVGKHSGQVIQRRFRQLVSELVEEDLAGMGPAGPRHDAAVRYVTGAFFEMVVWWLESRSALSPSDVADLFRRLTAPVLTALRGIR